MYILEFLPEDAKPVSKAWHRRQIESLPQWIERQKQHIKECEAKLAAAKSARSKIFWERRLEYSRRALRNYKRWRDGKLIPYQSPRLGVIVFVAK